VVQPAVLRVGIDDGVFEYPVQGVAMVTPAAKAVLRWTCTFEGHAFGWNEGVEHERRDVALSRE